MSIRSRTTRSILRLENAPFEFEGIEPYLEENASILMEATGTEPKDRDVLRLPGRGYDAEEHDGAAAHSLIKRAIDALEPSISGLRESASQSLRAHLEKWPIEDGDRTVTAVIRIEDLMTAKEKKSLWQRLFGG